ncbi:MAG: hypothetical protein EZS28_031556 [Streblomastix strix]|uniref:Uncharacterized protein n=1 Tax=Streblomastix strix TaxID=222440 RepID=A0A5J4URA7_9EUKA|nr:MAG: hypothetical protein EZS28_031556 [Streblomastix strix]
MGRKCLDYIYYWGDEQVQVELVTNGYPRLLVIVINTAGGNEQEQDGGIIQGLLNSIRFIYVILKGRETNQYNLCTPLSPQPDLLKSCQEQIEDEGGNEEIEAQLVNKQWNDDLQGNYIIKGTANWAKGSILNFYVDNNSPRPYWYNHV